MTHCAIGYHQLNRSFTDMAFMGLTHTLSGFAVMLALVAFAPDFTTSLLGGSALALTLLASFVVAGAALLPDLDNSASTARSTMGVAGVALSYVFRGVSLFLQTVIRTRRDDPAPDPHRGFWHTIPAALLMGFLVWLGTKLPGEFTLPFIGKLTGGGLFAFAIAVLLTHLALSSVAKTAMKKIKSSSPIGELVALLSSAIITGVIFHFLPAGLDYWWLGVSVALGMFVHTLGDTFTTAGTPIFFPLSALTRGKFWWKTRFTPMKAGGVAENYVVLPLFVVVILVSLVKIVSDLVVG